MNERILIIEDDQQILKLLQRGLSYEGYTVDTATDGRMGLILARDHTPDLVVLDWMLPGMDGLEVCHRLRTGGSIPILMLTAKDTVQDRIQGLDAGADDYMIKPFNLDELLARVRALLRRTQPERIPVLTFADLSLDTGSRQASREERTISLTAKEYELLELFLRHPELPHRLLQTRVGLDDLLVHLLERGVRLLLFAEIGHDGERAHELAVLVEG